MDYDLGEEAAQAHNQVWAADTAYVRLARQVHKRCPGKELHHLRRYGGIMYSNITVLDDDAFIAFYDSRGVGEDNITLQFNRSSHPAGYDRVVKEFERMWSGGDDALAALKPWGTSMIFYDSQGRVLMYLRDDKKEIKCPNRWDLLGGHPEADETPTQCIARELQEELEYSAAQPHLFSIYSFDDRTEYTYCAEENIDVAKTVLHEGQYLKWFTKQEIDDLPDDSFAFGFKKVLTEFYRLHLGSSTD